MKVKKVIILAGGKGTRISNLYPDLPKSLIPVNGKPFLYWIIKWLKKNEMNDILLSTGYLHKKIQNFIHNSEIFKNINISFSHEKFPLGTGGCIIKAFKSIEDEFATVINGDSLCLTDLKTFYNSFFKNRAVCSIVCKKIQNTNTFGTVKINNLIAESFDEKVDNNKSGYISVGIYNFHRNVFKDFELKNISLENDIFPNLSRLKLINTYKTNSPFLDIGTPERLDVADKFIKKNLSYFR